MGFYIDCSGVHGKADEIIKRYNATRVTKDEAEQAVKDGKGVICVVNNAVFEAAGFCFDMNEFEAFNAPGDERPKEWLVMDREQAEVACGCRQ